MTVPVRAVQRGAPGTYVYLVAADDTVSVHPVTLGAQDGDFFAVTAGLSPGDRVVTDGADRLRDGAKVSIPDSVQRRRPAARAAVRGPTAAIPATVRMGIAPDPTIAGIGSIIGTRSRMIRSKPKPTDDSSACGPPPSGN